MNIINGLSNISVKFTVVKIYKEGNRGRLEAQAKDFLLYLPEKGIKLRRSVFISRIENCLKTTIFFSFSAEEIDQ